MIWRLWASARAAGTNWLEQALNSCTAAEVSGLFKQVGNIIPMFTGLPLLLAEKVWELVLAVPIRDRLSISDSFR